jgi:hypothetical protein
MKARSKVAHAFDFISLYILQAQAKKAQLNFLFFCRWWVREKAQATARATYDEGCSENGDAFFVRNGLFPTRFLAFLAGSSPPLCTSLCNRRDLMLQLHGGILFVHRWGFDLPALSQRILYLAQRLPWMHCLLGGNVFSRGRPFILLDLHNRCHGRVQHMPRYVAWLLHAVMCVLICVCVYVCVYSMCA